MITLVSLMLSVAIEVVQLFMPIRVTSLTDPILASIAAIVGVIGYDYAVAFYRHARSLSILDMEGIRTTLRDTRSDETSAEGKWTVADEMIAGIAEPYEGAPREPDPSNIPIRKHNPSAP